MLCYILDIDVYPVDSIILILQTTESSLNILHTVLITVISYGVDKESLFNNQELL